jgi:hypothetical protein
MSKQRMMLSTWKFLWILGESSNSPSQRLRLLQPRHGAGILKESTTIQESERTAVVRELQPCGRIADRPTGTGSVSRPIKGAVRNQDFLGALRHEFGTFSGGWSVAVVVQSRSRPFPCAHLLSAVSIARPSPSSGVEGQTHPSGSIRD